MRSRGPARSPARGGTLEQRLREGMRLLSTAPAEADALARADALWLARVLPPLPPRQGSTPLLPAGPAVPPLPAALPAPAIHSGVPPPTPAAVPSRDTASLFVPQPGKAGGDDLKARRVQVPVADALPGRVEIERALRPLLRRRPSATRSRLDAEATAEASARAAAELTAVLRRVRGTRATPQQALVPVFRPVAERWFDLALLVEDDEAMRVFEDTIVQLRQLLAHHGAFGGVSLWRWSVDDGKVAMRSSSRQPVGKRAMLQTQRPQLLLVLTHGASPHWGREVLRGFVCDLARWAVVALMQLMPPRSWSFTALGEARGVVRSRQRASPNRQLQRLDEGSGLFEAQLDRAGAVPMFALDPQGLGEWAQWLMAARWGEHAAVELDPVPVAIAAPVPAGEGSANGAGAAPSERQVARDRVLRFRSIASSQAFALLRLLAATWVTLPVMRLLLQSLPGPRSTAPLAEVLMSGLLKRRSPAGTSVQETVFEFVPGVREWLHGGLTGSERRAGDDAMADAREQIRQHVEQKTGRTFASFEALLEDPSGTEVLDAAAKSFVEVAARLHALRGGGSVQGTPAAAAPPTAWGELHHMPPIAADLLPRPGLDRALLARIAALPEGGRLLLRARPEAGARTTLLRLLLMPEVRHRFTGGIWYDEPPPLRAPGDPAGPRLMLRVGGHAAPAGDTTIELQWHGQGPVDVDVLRDDEADAHLVAMGVGAAEARRLRRLHGGLPVLVSLVGAGALIPLRSWPRLPSRPEQRFAVLARHVVQRLAPVERQHLAVLAAVQTGFPATLVDETVARRLGWLCEAGVRGQSGTLHPSMARLLPGWLPDESQLAQVAIVSAVHQRLNAPNRATLADYASRHLIDHAFAGARSEDVAAMLFDRRVMQLLLAGDRRALQAATMRHAQTGPAFAAFQLRLHADLNDDDLVDHARGAFAPTGSLAGWSLADERAAAGIDGRGIRVAILSTGADASHPELQHLVVNGARTDPNGHGTAVASLIAGRYAGIAHGVQIQSLAPMDARGSGTTWTFLEAMEAVLATPDEQRAHIVCLPFDSRMPDGAVARGVQRLAKAGMLLVGPSGNDAGDKPNFPGSMVEVLCVGALDQNGMPSDYSNHPRDLWAPGDALLVAVPHGAVVASAKPKVSRRESNESLPALYARQSGTSLACAAVAGLAALCAQVTGQRGTALRELLMRVAGGPNSKARWDARAAMAQVAAVPGEDVVVVQLEDGLALVLHPYTARSLFDVPVAQR